MLLFGDEDRESVPVRIYRPLVQEDELLPAIVYYHGGGWVLMGRDTHHALCHLLCAEARAVVVSVEYRRAPEFPFPAAWEDAFAVGAWVRSEGAAMLGVDPSKVAVAGDSAGGNLAAAVAVSAQADDSLPPFAAQLLVYPVVDHRLDTPSYDRYSEGYLLTRANMRWFWNNYCPDEQLRNDPRASPLRASDVSRVPAALVVTASADVLRSEGEAYVEKLKAAGVAVRHHEFDRVIHGFATMLGMIPEAEQNVRLLASEFHAILSRQ
eukprot:TRINITY_DN2727_c0_g1_i1.p1 TRINITY_DN2727_c0_g1~~TRINITY_DN2727_c0_g1_i1.p1  ORF type:complete len:266 (+),score=91.73 TRINITY_DN2727_c0_g1_i1:474-1271(+)